MGEWRYSSTIPDLGTNGGEWSASRPSLCTPGKLSPGIHCIEGWVGPGTGLDFMVERKILLLPGMETWPSGP
jgi:hypothetical protein